MVCFPTPARAATASIVRPSKPRSSSSSRVAVTIARRDFSLRRRDGLSWLRSVGIWWILVSRNARPCVIELALHSSTHPGSLPQDETVRLARREDLSPVRLP